MDITDRCRTMNVNKMTDKCNTLIFITIVFLLFSTHDVDGELALTECCGDTRGCYHDCTDSGCDFLVTWLHRPDIGCIEISMNKKIEDMYNPQWFALGLSNDEYMGSDSVLECVTDRQNYWLADVTHSYNDQYYNRDVLRGKTGLREVIGRMQDGVLSCNFTRKIIVDGMEQIFNLDHPWYLFVASGYMKDVRNGHCIY